jgi:hypothetical protein
VTSLVSYRECRGRERLQSGMNPLTAALSMGRLEGRRPLEGRLLLGFSIANVIRGGPMLLRTLYVDQVYHSGRDEGYHAKRPLHRGSVQVGFPHTNFKTISGHIDSMESGFLSWQARSASIGRGLARRQALRITEVVKWSTCRHWTVSLGTPK